MKVSVSLKDSDVEFLDALTEQHGFASRSAAVARALKTFRELHLGDAYEKAWHQWEESGEAGAWESAAGDGLDDAEW